MWPLRLVMVWWCVVASQRVFVVDAFLLDYRYTAPDDSAVGRGVPCSPRERHCLRFNRLYHPGTDACYPFLDGPHNCVFVGERGEFRFGSGHLRGKCLAQPPCCLRETVSAFHCAMDEYLKENFCEPGNNMTWSVGVFGNFECRCLRGTTCRESVKFPPAPRWEYVDSEVVAAAGRCRVPSLAAGDVLSTPLAPSVRPTLPPAAALRRHLHCLAFGRVWVVRARACYALRTRGPCPPGHTLVLHRGLWLEGRVVAVCERRFLCGPGFRRLAFDGRCYPEDALRAALRPNEDLVLNRFGETYAAFRRTRPLPAPSSLHSRLQGLRGNCHAAAEGNAEVIRRYLYGEWMEGLEKRNESIIYVK